MGVQLTGVICLIIHRYFELYLECLATNENISLLYHLAQLVKGARDAASSSFDTVRFMSHSLRPLIPLLTKFDRYAESVHSFRTRSTPRQVIRRTAHLATHNSTQIYSRCQATRRCVQGYQ